MNALPIIALLLCAFGGTSAPGARHYLPASGVKAQQPEKPRRGINLKLPKLRLHETHLALELRWGFNLPEGELASDVLDGKYVLNEVDSAQGTQRRYHYGGAAALAIADAQGSRFLNLDALGSPTQETSASTGAVSKVRQTDAWGRYRNGTAPGASEAKLSFTGHQYDVESGLTYARARYYDAETGRMLSRDLVDGDVSSAPSLHAYLYAWGNPLRYTDPDGTCVDANGNLVNCAKMAEDWEVKRAEYRKWLASEIEPDISTWKALGLAAPTLAVELGAGLMDLARLGEGSAEGGASGYGKDALRALGIAMMGRGLARAVLPTEVPITVVEDLGGVGTKQVVAPKAGQVEPPTPPAPPARHGPPSGAGSGGTPPRSEPRPTQGEPHAPGDVPNDFVLVRGGQSPMPPPGKTFSCGQGTCLPEAAETVPHGTIRTTTAGAVRAGGGEVTVAPELNPKTGLINYRHVDVTEGSGVSSFSAPGKNPVAPKQRLAGPYMVPSKKSPDPQ